MAKAATKTKKSAPAKSSSKSKSSGSAGSQNTMLEKFIYDSMKDIYYAEKAVLKAMPKMKKAATTQQLKDAFTTHMEQTRGQISRLEQGFEIMGKKVQGKKCEAIEGLIAEAESIIEDTEDGTMTRDVALIIAAQKLEHYEIASYGGMAQLTRTLGMDDIAELLEQTLEEEKETDLLLTSIAENDINLQAEEEGSEEEA